MKSSKLFAAARSNVRKSIVRRQLLVEGLERRDLLAGDVDVFGGGWGTDASLCVVPAAMYDVTGDGVVSAGDVLAEVNFLNGRQDGGGVGARPVDMYTFQFDVNGDGWGTALDALVIVNEINYRGVYEVEDVLRCDNVVTFQQSSPAEVFAQQGEDSVLLETQVWAEKAEATIRGMDFRGNLESFDNLYVSIDWDGDGWQDATSLVSSTWFDEEQGTTYAWFDLRDVATAPKYGYLGLELHGTPITGAGSQSTIELSYASVESWSGFDTRAETDGVGAMVTTVELEVVVVDLSSTFVPGANNVWLGTPGFDFIGASNVHVTEDVFVMIRAEYPEGTDPLWVEDVMPHITLSGENDTREGHGWTGWWADGNVIEEVFRFERMPLGDDVFYDVIAVSSVDIPTGARFQISVVDGDSFQLVSPGAVGEWHEATDAAFADLGA